MAKAPIELVEVGDFPRKPLAKAVMEANGVSRFNLFQKGALFPAPIPLPVRLECVVYVSHRAASDAHTLVS
jgi:hypothetical protein